MIIAAAIMDVFNQIETVIIVMCVVMCYTGASNTLNDYLDKDIDLVNRPMRPIPSGKVEINAALYMSIILFVIGTFFCLNLSEPAKVIGIVIAMPLLIFYTKYFKGIPLIGNMIVAFIIGLSFLFSGAAFGQMNIMWTPMLLAFGLTLVREIVKDIEDIKGDKLQGLKTLPIMIGEYYTIRFIVILSVFMGFGFIIPFYKEIYGIWYLILLIVVVEIPLTLVIFFLLSKPNAHSAKKSSKLLKFSTLGGLISIYAGTIL